MTPSRPIVVAVALLMVAGCASGGPPGTSGGATQQSSPRGSGNVITQEELEASSTQTALDAIQRLRPNFLATRGASSLSPGEQGIVVYANGLRLGGTETLRDIPVTDIKRIEFLSASDATQRFGTGHAHGAILLTRK